MKKEKKIKSVTKSIILKKITIFCIFFSITVPSIHYNEKNNEINFKKIQNKKMVSGINKRVWWTKSFLAIYISKNGTYCYSHKSSVDEIYDIASVTKTFTSIICIKLHSKKIINLDEKVSKYIMYYDKNVTIRHLITHSSFFPYGTDSSYSNINYMTLKRIIEKTTRRSFEFNADTFILSPVEMSSTCARYSNGAGSIYSTGRDLVKYCTMLKNKGEYNGKTVLTEKEYDILTESSRERRFRDWYWSSGGFEVFSKKNKMTSFYKSGRWYNSVTGIEIFPDKNKALIYLSQPHRLPKRNLSHRTSRWRTWTWRYLKRHIYMF